MAHDHPHPTAGSSALRQPERFTLEQWRQWPEGERWELIAGEAFDMSPSPRTRHQKVAGRIFHLLCSLLEAKACQPFIAPIDVFLPGVLDDSDDTVVEPDVLVVCDPAKVREDGIHGSPDFIVEVLSPSTAYKDMGRKKELYEKAGVREYWLVNPETGSVFRYLLSDGRYGPATELLRGQEVASAVLPGFVLVME
jgi:Uma2 family endonuclease